MATYQLFQLPKQLNISSSFTLSAGAKAYFYATTTTTPQDTYTTSALSVAHPNPVVADAAGVLPAIYLNPALQYRLTLNTSADVLIYTVDPVNDQLLSQLIIGQLLYPRTSAEISAAVTPTNYYYPPLDVRRYGGVADGLLASATINSTAIQAAIDVAYAAGGGLVQFQAGTYGVNAVPLLWNTVSIRGMGRFTTFIQKMTTTASTITDNTVRRWDSAVVGFPVCCMHAVHHNGVNNWSDGVISDIGFLADTTSPNTTTTIYGLFLRGCSGGIVQNTYSRYCQVGYFWGAGATLDSVFTFNQAADTQRGFYQHFATSTMYFANFANKFRFSGHFGSYYYSNVMDCAADNAGSVWKVGTTEIALAYEMNGNKGGSFIGNGCETHNGSVWKFTNNIGTRFSNNTALDISSNYTGGSDVVLLELNGNINCEFFNNRAQTSGMTGTGARHFIWKITAETLPINERNRFIAAVGDTTDTSTWTNTSGTFVETIPQVFSESSFVGTLTGCTTAPTINVFWSRSGNKVTLSFTNLTAVSNTVACTITGMPVSIRPAAQQIVPARIMDNSVVAFGLVIVELTGVLTLGVGATAAAFTAANNKGIQQCSISYRIG